MTDRMNGGPICRSGIPAGSMIGVPCPNCGHTDLAHPGGHNPAIGECLLCRLEAMIEQLAPLLDQVTGEKSEEPPP
jgi:hypothetical protein